MAAIVIVGPLLLAAVLWWLLNRHETRRAAEGLQRHSGLRLVAASAAILAALFTGGCSLLFAINMDGLYVNLPAIGVIGGIPFAAALLWSRVTMARQSSLAIKLAALAAVFITCSYAVAAVTLTGTASEDSIVPGLMIAAVVTGAVALWLFLRRNPANPPPS